MNAVLAIIANGGRAFVDVDIEASRNKLMYHLLYNFILNPLTSASSNPLRRGSRGCSMFVHQNHAARWENGSSWWGCLWAVCFVSKKQKFFVPARMHLCVKLLRGYQIQTESSYEKMHHHDNLKNLGCWIMEVKWTHITRYGASLGGQKTRKRDILRVFSMSDL